MVEIDIAIENTCIVSITPGCTYDKIIMTAEDIMIIRKCALVRIIIHQILVNYALIALYHQSGIQMQGRDASVFIQHTSTIITMIGVLMH